MLFAAYNLFGTNVPRVHATTFTTSGSWTVPAGTTYATFEAWGGGGGGGGVGSNPIVTEGAGGGSGGQYVKRAITVTVGNVYTVTVAAAVAGDNTGSAAPNGNDSSVTISATTVALAKGGQGGNRSFVGCGGLSLTGSIGDVIYSGGNGGNGTLNCVGTNTGGAGGGGGAGSTGNGGAGSDTTVTGGTGAASNGGNGGNGAPGSASGAGSAGSNYGGGGGGAYSTVGTNTAKSGGGGAQGLVVITAYTATPNGQGGQTKFYFHKERSDANQLYNSMGLTQPEPAADTGSATTVSGTTYSSASPSLCNSANNTGDNLNQVSNLASQQSGTATTGELCEATFISSEIGNTISFDSVNDTASITGQFWSSESNSASVTANLQAYIYAWGGGALVPSNLIASFTGTTCADPGTSATSCTPTAVKPANSVIMLPGYRLVVVVTMNITAASTTRTISTYFDSSARAAAGITLGYSALGNSGANKPALTGTMDDDFTTNLATTACSTSGVAYNTKWTCLNGAAASTTGAINAGGASGPTGDSSGWLWLRNQTTATTATTCDFNANSAGTCATPSNTYLYQAMPSSYGSGNLTTVINPSAFYDVGATPTNSGTPYSHSGLVVWTSNTDYLELQVYANAATTGANSVNVALNNSGTLSGVTSLNPATTSGNYGSVWLRFVNTTGSWQAQYSTDGTTFTNVGSAVSHSTAFSRTGLNSYTAIANPVTSNSGAFEWFQSTISSASNSAPNAPTLSSPTNGSTVTTLTPSLSLSGTDPNAGDTLKFDVLIYNTTTNNGTTCSGSLNQEDDQNVSGTGWNNGTVAYSQGVTATYTIQSGAALSGGNGYCWQAKAKDPSGSNTFGALSTPFTFNVAPTTDQQMRGGAYFSNGAKQPIYWAQ